MRTREEIENSGTQSGSTFIGDSYHKLQLEVLLDIRDILQEQSKPKEVAGNWTHIPVGGGFSNQGGFTITGDGTTEIK